MERTTLDREGHSVPFAPMSLYDIMVQNATGLRKILTH